MKSKLLVALISVVVNNYSAKGQSRLDLSLMNISNYWDKEGLWQYKDIGLQPAMDIGYNYAIKKINFGVALGIWRQTFEKRFKFESAPNVINLYEYKRISYFINPTIGYNVFNSKKWYVRYGIGLSFIYTPEMQEYRRSQNGWTTHELLYNLDWGSPISFNNTISLDRSYKKFFIGTSLKLESRIKTYYQFDNQLEKIKDSRFYVSPSLRISYVLSKKNKI